MNRIHRHIWSKRLGAYVVVAENSRSAGKSVGVTGALLGAVLLSASGLTLGSTLSANTLPSGGQVVAGQAGISQSGNALTVTQGSSKAAINWQSFSVGSNANVNFVQPSAQSVVLNQVLGADVSVIQGSITANGQVFMVNPNGVLFTPTAQVNVGALVASTQNISTADFMSGNYKFSGNSTASVENQGRITAANGGAVALIAARVVNSGQITANAGQVALAAANTVTLDLGGPVLLRVSEGALNAIIEQNGGIRADGGTIYLTAQAAGNLAASVINHTGVTQAQTLADVTGNIKLSADIVSHTGKLDASSDAGRAGRIVVEASTLIDAGATTVNGTQAAGTITETAQSILQATAARLSADSRDGQGGSINLLGGVSDVGRAWLSGHISATGVQGGEISASANEVAAAGFQADSSGTVQAGRIRMGGGWQGNDTSLPNAQTTRVGNDVQLTNQGADGRVVVWSDKQTTFAGRINATQSAAEVSGKENLAFAGTTQTASLLLDPKNITIGDPQKQLDMLTFRDPAQNSTGNFGKQIETLNNGNVVITAHQQGAGAVYMFSSTGALISTLAGSDVNDSVGSAGVTTLSNGNYVVSSPLWNIGRGAVTFVNGSTGLNGVVSSTNSLTGAHVNDSVGVGGVTALSNGNYVVNSPNLRTDTLSNVGAVTWGSGSTGTTGSVDSSNSLIGNATNDRVGSGGVTALANGGYVVVSPGWGAQRGAVTWVSDASTTGVSGVISSTNSLVGRWGTDIPNGSLAAGDSVGSGGLIKLSNGKYLISSPVTNSSPVSLNGQSDTQLLTGALTWVDPAVGVRGVIGSANSMVGTITGDSLGSGGIVEVGAAGSGNFVVISPMWHNGTYTVPALGNRQAKDYQNVSGAVTFVNGSTGLTGTLNSGNSLIEGTNPAADAGAGKGGVTVLANGNYVVKSRSGATWGDGSTGIAGVIDATNTLLMGTGSSVLALSNGNYVVSSPDFNSQKGAVTWGNGTSGVKGVVSSANSLTSLNADAVGSGGIKEVGGSNYVVLSPLWQSQKGAVTWGSGSVGVSGVVSSSNSLVGDIHGPVVDRVGLGGITVLSNGNYVVTSYGWNYSTGAVTWGSASAGVAGVVSSTNSMVGAHTTDSVGYGGVTALSNGNYVIASPRWANGNVLWAGAATWGNGATGSVGVVGSSNSLVGQATYDQVSSGGVVALPNNGNYVVVSPLWSQINLGPSGIISRGAVTWGNGATGITGAVGSSNSLVGSVIGVGAMTGDAVGSGGVKALSNGNYVVLSPDWNQTAGAVTWGNGTTGLSGVVSSANSLVGSVDDGFKAIGTTFAEVGSPGSGNYVVSSAPYFGKGAVTWGSGSTGVKGAVSSENSLIGGFGGDNLTPGDQVGSGGVTVLRNGDYVVNSDWFSNKAGAVSWGDGNVGARGVVGQTNSILNTGHGAAIAVINGKAWVKSPETGYAYRINGGVVDAQTDAVSSATFANNPTADSYITGGTLKSLLDNGTAVTLQANNDITLKDALTVSANGHGGALTLLAGRNVNINAALTTDNGNFTAVAGSANTDVVAANKLIGNPTLTIGSAGSIHAGTGTVNLSTTFFDNQNTSTSTITAGLTNLFMPFVNKPVVWPSLKLGGLTQDGKRYNTTFDESTGTGACLVDGCVMPTRGFNVLYTSQPALLSVTPSTGQTSTYGQTYAGGGYTVSGFIDGDTESTAGISGTAQFIVAYNGASSSGTVKVGTYDVRYTSGLLSSLGYRLQNFTAQTGELQVLPAAISTITGITAANKIYDGSTAAILNVSNPAITGTIPGDAVSLNAANARGSFVDKNVGQGKTVNVTGLTLSGIDAANYTVQGFSTTASITAATNPQSMGAIPPAGAPGGVLPAPSGPINSNPGNTAPKTPAAADTTSNPTADTNPSSDSDPDKKKP